MRTKINSTCRLMAASFILSIYSLTSYCQSAVDSVNSFAEYVRLKRNSEAVDSITREAWFSGHTKVVKEIANDFVSSLSDNELVKAGNVKNITFMAAAANSKDHGFDLSILNQRYSDLLNAYRTGTRGGEFEQALARFANLLADQKTAAEVSAKFIISLKPSDYNKDNLEFVKDFTKKTTDPGTKILLKNAALVNSKTETHFAELALGYIIHASEIAPNIANGNPDWPKIKTHLIKKYGAIGQEEYLRSKMHYFLNSSDVNSALQSTMEYMSKYLQYEKRIVQLNDIAWYFFENSNNRLQLSAALSWSKKAIQSEPSAHFMDTYANLLHKLGRTAEAIIWEQKAFDKLNTDSIFLTTLNKMKKGQPTWPGTVTTVNFNIKLNWEALLNKAKAENKYVMLDFMATWCGPCKEMDKYAYTDSEVGKVLNKNFISVKIQCDRKPSDSDYVKSWYADAERLIKQYEITAYPTLLFLSPSGKVLKKIVGAVDATALNNAAEEVLNKEK